LLALITLQVESRLFAMKVKKPYHHGALRQALIDEAFKALETGGLDGLSLRSLAAKAGVSKTAPYRHFAGKRELLVALAAEGFRILADALEGALSVASGGFGSHPTESIQSLFRAYLQFAGTRPALYRLMLSPLGFSLHSESCRINSERAFGCLVQAVEQARARGWRSGQDSLGLVLSLWAEVHGWAGLLIDGLLPRDFPPSLDSISRASQALLD
jgi:AcrR family transcriptional regulator